MPQQDKEVLEKRTAQRDRNRRATFDLLLNKPRVEREISFQLPVEGGGEQEVTMLLRAISGTKYDRMLADHPPTKEQKADGSSYNVNTFGPALLADVVVEPELTGAEWRELWNSPAWNRGEIMELFLAAVQLCNQGLDIPFGKDA